MKIQPRKDNRGYVTLYYASLGSKEVRDAGFLDENGKSKVIKKIVDVEKHTITMYVDEEATAQERQ